MDTSTSAIMFFKGAKYRIDTIVGLAKTAARIEVKPEDINPLDPDHQHEELRVSFLKAGQSKPDELNWIPNELAYGEVVFFKQEGRFTVLLGQLSAQRMLRDGIMHVRGRIVSGPMLKKARIEESSTVNIHEPIREEPSKPLWQSETRRQEERRRRPYDNTREHSRYNNGERGQRRYQASNGTTTRRDLTKS